MVAKKQVPSKAQGRNTMRIEWVFDPGPQWMNINKAALAKINQMKKDFVTNVNKEIAKGQV